MTRYAITSLGCKVNQYDAAATEALLERAGLTPATDGQAPDLLVVQTCCVTTSAMRKSRQAIRRMLRKAPRARLCVLGCYAAYHPDRLAELLDRAGVDVDRRLILSRHDDLPAQLRAWLEDPHQGDSPSGGPGDLKQRWQQARRENPTGDLPAIDRFPGHQRAFVKVQDGCDAFCTYCVVPYTRPHVTSRPVEDVLAECRRLVRVGHREIVLCGVFLGAFGQTTAVRRRWQRPSPLPDLLRQVAQIDGLWRVRLSSLEVGDVTDELLDVFAETPAVAPHLHLPLQSGCDRILRRMNRQYTRDAFLQTLERFARARADATVTTDIVVGFPGEDEAAFADTLQVAEQARFARIHAFAFSAIRPTPAWRHRREAPPADVVRRRMNRLAEIEAGSARTARQRLIGRTLEGLIESHRPPAATAMTEYYLPIRFDAPGPDRRGQVVRLEVIGQDDVQLLGRLVE